jgi:hypothetical protein
MSELVSTSAQVYLAALIAVLGWTLVEMLVRGGEQVRRSRVRPAAFWSAYSVVTTIVVVLTVRYALVA